MDIGHNQPPGMIDTAAETAKDISAWMAEMPIIETEESARDAKLFLDRGKLCIKDLEDERDGKVRPLNEQVKAINETYKSPRDKLQTLILTLGNRLAFFLRAEEQRRLAAAKEAARIAEEAEQRAREAERLEQDAIASADSGELGVDIAAHVDAANSAFRDFEKADRQAARAEKETHVKIGGGFSRAVSLRPKETLIVRDPVVAITEIGLTEEIQEAIIKSARAYRKLRGRLPGGVNAEYTDGI